MKRTVQMYQSFTKMHIALPVQWQLRSRRQLAKGKTGQVGDVKALLVNEGQGNNVINRIVDYIDHWYIGYC